MGNGVKRKNYNFSLLFNNIKILDSKAQVALEYMISHGWVILVVVISISALAYFGILSPSKYVPEGCVLEAGMACMDYNIETSRIIMVLQNSLGYDLKLDRTEVFSKDGSYCILSTPEIIKSGEKIIVTIWGCSNGNIGEKYLGDINIDYTLMKDDYSIAKMIRGKLSGKVERESPISTPLICGNAENAGLCSELDILFGQGYQAACCSEHSLCCS